MTPEDLKEIKSIVMEALKEHEENKKKIKLKQIMLRQRAEIVRFNEGIERQFKRDRRKSRIIKVRMGRERQKRIDDNMKAISAKRSIFNIHRWSFKK